jgi:hypothetical protein
VADRIPRLTAAEDPRLLGAVPLWPVQREILGAIDDGSERTHIFRIGRRGGKGYVGALLALHSLLLSPHLDKFVRSGERRYGLFIGRRQEQAKVPLDMALSIVRASPTLAGTLEDVTDTRIDFTNGTSLIAAPCSADSIRGIPICFLDFVEAAHWLGEAETAEEAGDRSAWKAEKALRPGLAQFGRDRLFIVESTPRARRGYFYETCTRAEAGEDPDARAWHFTTEQANPEIDRDFLAAEKARDPDNYRIEFDAEWSDGPSAFIDFERFTTKRDVDVPPEHLAAPVVLGCDMAQSGTVGVAVTGRDPNQPRRLVVAHVDGLRLSRARSLVGMAKAQTGLLDQVVKIAKRYSAEVAVDQYASKQVLAHFHDRGVHCKLLQQGAASKDAGYRETRDRLYSGDLDVPADGPLLADLRRLRTRFTATGSSSVVNPRIKGGHGDRCSALVLAVERQVEHGAVGVPAGKPSGGAAMVNSDPGVGLGTARTQSELLEREKSNKWGRAGRKDPDRPGVRFGGGGSGFNRDF